MQQLPGTTTIKRQFSFTIVLNYFSCSQKILGISSVQMHEKLKI